MPRLLAETPPDEIGGGEQAISSLPPPGGYQGHCAIVMSGSGKVIAVLPNAEEAPGLPGMPFGPRAAMARSNSSQHLSNH